MELLLFPAIVLYLSLFVLGYWGSKSVPIAWWVATIKTSLFVLYFGYFFDGTYTSVDDEYYLVTGQQIYQLLLGGDTSLISVEQMQAITGGAHIIYSIINALSFLSFGQFYFSPIVINIIISAVASVISVKIVKQQKLIRENELKYFFLFFCLHPELLSWSTVFNGKDTIVLFANLLLLSSVSLFILHKNFAALVTVIFATVVLFSLRFYVPVIFGLCFLIYLILDNQLSLKKAIKFSFLLCLFLYFVFPSQDLLNYSMDIYRNAFINPLTGAVHFVLTPRPFFTDSIHEFLTFASAINWLFFPMFLMGAYICFRSRNEFAHFLVVYLLIFVLFYGGFYDLNGPRHRLQLLFPISVFQFIGLKWLMRQVLLPPATNFPAKAETKT